MKHGGVNGRQQPDIEPEVDPDSSELLAEEHLDPAHGPSRFDAGTGQGTVDGPPYDREFQERPILDGSTLSAEAEASVPNPHRGESDPALIHRQPALNTTSTNRWIYSGIVAYLVVGAVLIALFRWDPLWCSIGLAVGLLALAAMLIVRATKLERPARLWVDAALMAVLWLVPLAIIVSIMIGRSEQIW